MQSFSLFCSYISSQFMANFLGNCSLLKIVCEDIMNFCFWFISLFPPAPDCLQTLGRPKTTTTSKVVGDINKIERRQLALPLSIANLTVIFCIHVFGLVFVRWRLPHSLGTRFEFPQFLERETGVLVTLCRTQGVGYDRRVFARYSAQFANVLFAQRRNYSIWLEK